MKKYSFIFFMVLVMMLAACGEKPPKDTDGTTQNPNVTTEEPKVEVVEVSILDNKVNVDEKGILSYIYNEYIEDNLQQQIYNFQENILIANSMYNGKTGEFFYTLELVSTQTGELMAKADITCVDVPTLQIMERNLVVSDMVTGKVLVLDSSLKTEKEYQVDDGTAFLNRMMTKAFVLNKESGIDVVDLETGTSKRWMKEIERAYISKVCGDYVSLTYTDAKTGLSGYALLNLAAEEIDILDLNESLYAVEHNSRLWLAGLVGDAAKYFYGTEEVPRMLELEPGISPTLVTNSDELILTKYLGDDSVELTAYRPDGTYLSKMNLPNGAMGYWGNIVWFESLHGYLVTNIEGEGIDKLYYWDTSVETEGNDLTFTEMESEVQTGDSVSKDLYEKANKIGDKYGVTIKIAEQCETDYGTYTVEQNLNEDKISRGLDIIDLSLTSYPEGFIKQLHFGFYRELEINLMGSIYATEQVEENKNGFDSFIAFVQQQEEKYVMIFDLSRGQLMEQDLYHEFSHLIDKKLQHQAERGKAKKYSEEAWAALNPKGFDYCYNYADMPASYYNDGYDDYFIDVYSRTFPTEDRARVLEYAMIGAEFCFDSYPKLVSKLEYYCDCIREGFDTTGWPEVTKWEEMLFLVD